MGKLFLGLVMAVAVLFPWRASAQEASPAVPPAIEQAIEGIDASRVVAIGAGILIGAVAMEVLIAGDVVILTGAAIGGFLTDWWYRRTAYTTAMPQINYRVAAASPPQDITLAMLVRR